MPERKKSGLEKVPNILSRPLWKDGFIWWGIATAIFWTLVIWWLFF